MPKDDIVRASEIGSFIYCARAWWLHRVKGYQPDNVTDLERGDAVHLAHGRTIASSYRWQRWAYVLIGTSVLTGLFVILRIV